MQTLIGSLDVNNIVSPVFQKKLETRPVGRSNKSRKDKPQKFVLIEVNQNMRENDTEQFTNLFDKYRHIYG